MASVGSRVGAEFIVDAFERHGIDRLYTFPGGTVAAIFDAAIARGIPIFTGRHEQGAGYAALAAARLGGRPQVVLVTSGPGVTNLVTTVADAYFDSTPLVVCTGQVGTGDMRGDLPVRQRGFQEVDTIALMRPITKEQILPRHPNEVPAAIERAFRTASEGRPGPVVIDLPMNVQRGEVDEPAETPERQSATPAAPDEALDAAAAALAGAQRPLVIAGQGVLLAGATEELRALVRGRGIPVSHSLLGLGALPGDDPLALGFHGHTGNQYAGLAIHNADIVLVVGSRLDVRQTGSEVADFAPGATIVRVEADPAELDHSRIRTDIAVFGDARAALAGLLERSGGGPDLAPWREQIAAWRREHALTVAAEGQLKPQEVIVAANELTRGRDFVVVTGVGLHQQWVARHFDVDFPRRPLLTSGGHGAMGYDLPTAVGAALQGREVLCFVGDGSLQINIQELASVVDQELPIKIVVLDNHRLGIVSQFQLLNWGSDPTCGEKWNPDFAAIARAYGIPSWSVADRAELVETLTEALAAPGAALVHCAVDPEEDIVPMLLAGQRLDRMWPLGE